MSKELCLAVGAGAIGKSITGYIFSQLGFKVVFADVNQSVIDNINHRQEYMIDSDENGNMDSKLIVKGISAVNINNIEAEKLAEKADYICTAIGSNAMKLFIPVFLRWISERNKNSKKNLYILLFENDLSCRETLTNAIIREIGYFPKWLKITKTSIERMSKLNDKTYDVIAEKFIPVILEKGQLADSSIFGYEQYFNFVENVDAYYYRKLYTNNLGHAVIGYIGTFYGYKTVLQALENKFIVNCLEGALNESARMLKCSYGFNHEEIDNHIKFLFDRYKNRRMNDNLQRLTRDPLRKLRKNERIMGALLKCELHGIYAENIIITLFYAICYRDREDQAACELEKILLKGGISAVLKKVCNLSETEPLYFKLCSLYRTAELNIINKNMGGKENEL